MSTSSSFFSALKCRECSRKYPTEAFYVCEFCFGPLEVDYHYDGIQQVLTRNLIESRPKTMWRYRELLPIAGRVTVGFHVGFTPLIKADRLAKSLGVRAVWIKNDAVNYPSLSFKDRVVSVALTRAIELGFDTVSCASTGNLANSVAANAAGAGLRSYVFIPDDLEPAKVMASLVYGTTLIPVSGTYDQVNRLCAEIAGRHNWAFTNINLRPYYAEGSKSMGFEIAEQLGWKLPDHVVVPMAGGSLITKIDKAFKELAVLELIPETPVKIHGAQAKNCAPIANAFEAGTDHVIPVKKPETLVKSLAIGNPADGYYALQTMRKSGGSAATATDDETVAGIRLLAKDAGVFAETAGGVVVAAAKRLIEEGRIDRDDSVVLCITGNGLKTKEVLNGQLAARASIDPNLNEFEQFLEAERRV